MVLSSVVAASSTADAPLKPGNCVLAAHPCFENRTAGLLSRGGTGAFGYSVTSTSARSRTAAMAGYWSGVSAKRQMLQMQAVKPVGGLALRPVQYGKIRSRPRDRSGSSTGSIDGYACARRRASKSNWNKSTTLCPPLPSLRRALNP
jgi:hypothetical protein